MKQQRMVCMAAVGMAALVAATSCTPRAERPAAAWSNDPLQAGWQFACAITNDSNDRAECQEKIALAHLARGEGDKALALGEQIANWRKGVVLAEVAAMLAANGQTDAALQRAAQAEAIGRGIQDWQRDRILARVAKTSALLGRSEDVGRWSAFYQSNQDYRGETAAYHALALARRGEATNALAVLDGLADAKHLDVLSWRANGYLLLAKAGHLDSTQTSNALEQAWEASASVPGNKRFDVQIELMDEAVRLGALAQAESWMEALHSNTLSWAAPAHIKAPVVARLGVQCGLLGQRERLTECELAAEPLIRQLQKIEQPALYALLGEARARLGDVQQAETHYRHAMEMAEELTNLRPRAIACVDICLSLDRARLRLKWVGEGLNRLWMTFGAAHG